MTDKQVRTKTAAFLRTLGVPHYHRRAPDDAPQLYIVYTLVSIRDLGSYGRQYMVDFDAWDIGGGGLLRAEELCDKIEGGLHRRVVNGLWWGRETKIWIEDENKKTAHRRITFEARSYEEG